MWSNRYPGKLASARYFRLSGLTWVKIRVWGDSAYAG